MKKQNGFTLIELIIVIAVLAVLAGVALPAYSGYVQRARDAQVLVELDYILTTVYAANAEGDAISKVKIESDGKTIIVSSASRGEGIHSDFNENFCELYGCTWGNNSFETQEGRIFRASDRLIDLSDSSFERGAVWYADDRAGHEAGWHPLG